ncbi:MAG: OsmC family protein [bacterium]|nr:MAG: OsmC family protein [bacterium]
MEMEIVFPGGKKVDANYKGFNIKTDQSVFSGGDNSAPAPFDLFLASIGTCAGIYVLGFCQQRGIPTKGIKIIQKMIMDQIKRKIGTISLEIQVPPEFPEQYKDAVVRSAELCAVKKHLHDPPKFDIYTKVVNGN